jgi:hypothetical protein
MLGNNADQFMTTPMMHSITTQEQRASQMEMPAPRPTAMASFIPGIGDASFLPGIGDASFLPGIGNYVSAPAYAGTGFMDFGSPKNLLLLAGLGIGAFMLLGRKGKGGSGSKGHGKVQYK